MTRTPHDDRTGERGAAAVELALVVPILLMLLIGIVEFGKYYSARITVTSAAREGVRAVALGEDGATAARLAATGLDSPTRFSVSAPAPCDDDDHGDVAVTTSYGFDFRIPLLPARTVTIQSTGVMRCGG